MQRADPGVLAEERGERGRARTREADSEQLDFHFLVRDLRVTGVPVLDLQSVGEGADDRVVEHVLTEVVEVRLGERRAQQHLEPLAPRVDAEVVQAGVGARPVDELLFSRRDGGVGCAHGRSTRSGGIERSIMPLADSPSSV